MLHIIGHKNPDTDSICAALAYANLKNKLGYDARAYRIGDLNEETMFILKKLKQSAPEYLGSAKNRLYEIEFDQPLLVHKNDTIKYAWNKIKGSRAKSLTVIDDNQQLEGMVSMSDLSRFLMREYVEFPEYMKSALLKDIAETIGASILVHPTTFLNNGHVHFLSVVQDIKDVKDSIVVSHSHEVCRQCLEQKPACIVLLNITDCDELLERAKQLKVAILRSTHSIIHIAREIFQAIPVTVLMSTNTVTFDSKSFVDDVYNRISKTRFRSYPVVNDENKVIGQVSRYHLLASEKKRFVLVDHNEFTQSIDDLESGEVSEIIDHHRIGNVETTHPIMFRNQIVGSTCTMITNIYREEGVEITKKIACLLLSGILSDTMNFQSPTTTDIDRRCAEELSAISGIHIDEYAKEIFAITATIHGKTYSEILYHDFKEYSIQNYSVAVGQINLSNLDEVYAIEKEFTEYMSMINNVNTFDLMMMCFTMVDGTGSYMISCGKIKDVIKEAFKDDLKDQFLKNIMSRKKQIVPKLTDALNDY